MEWYGFLERILQPVSVVDWLVAVVTNHLVRCRPGPLYGETRPSAPTATCSSAIVVHVVGLPLGRRAISGHCPVPWFVDISVC